MIQRIQTLFLAGVVIISIVIFYLPLYSFNFSGDALPHQVVLAENIYLTSLNCIILLLALAIIFMYRNRKNQIIFCSMNMLLVSILIVSNFYFSDTGRADADVKFETGSYLVLVNLILLWLAVRFIRKDERLIRSADRLR